MQNKNGIKTTAVSILIGVLLYLGLMTSRYRETKRLLDDTAHLDSPMRETGKGKTAPTNSTNERRIPNRTAALALNKTNPAKPSRPLRRSDDAPNETITLLAPWFLSIGMTPETVLRINGMLEERDQVERDVRSVSFKQGLVDRKLIDYSVGVATTDINSQLQQILGAENYIQMEKRFEFASEYKAIREKVAPQVALVAPALTEHQMIQLAEINRGFNTRLQDALGFGSSDHVSVRTLDFSDIIKQSETFLNPRQSGVAKAYLDEQIARGAAVQEVIQNATIRASDRAKAMARPK
jgi:hypothetical protein